MKILLLTSLSVFILVSCATNIKKVEKPIFKGEPTFKLLNNNSLQKLSALNAPAVNFRKLKYSVTDPKSSKLFAKVTYELRDQQNNLARISSHAESTEKAGLLGVRGTTLRDTVEISVGGLINCASQAFVSSKDNLITNKNSLIKYLLSEVANLKGGLFPLNVGNRLSFKKTYLLKKGLKDDGLSDREYSTLESFEVLKELNNYSVNNITYPGRTFLIQQITTYSNDKQKRTVIYYNDDINWVIGKELYRDKKKYQLTILEKWE